jgi:hypothetical protein
LVSAGGPSTKKGFVDPLRLITLLLEIGKMKADMGAIISKRYASSDNRHANDFIPTLFSVIL